MATIRFTQEYTVTIEIATANDLPAIEQVIELTSGLAGFIERESKDKVKVYLSENTDVTVESIYINNVRYSYDQLNSSIEPFNTFED